MDHGHVGGLHGGAPRQQRGRPHARAQPRELLRLAQPARGHQQIEVLPRQLGDRAPEQIGVPGRALGHVDQRALAAAGRRPGGRVGRRPRQRAHVAPVRRQAVGGVDERRAGDGDDRVASAAEVPGTGRGQPERRPDGCHHVRRPGPGGRAPRPACTRSQHPSRAARVACVAKAVSPDDRAATERRRLQVVHQVQPRHPRALTGQPARHPGAGDHHVRPHPVDHGGVSLHVRAQLLLGGVPPGRAPLALGGDLRHGMPGEALGVDHLRPRAAVGHLHVVPALAQPPADLHARAHVREPGRRCVRHQQDARHQSPRIGRSRRSISSSRGSRSCSTWSVACSMPKRSTSIWASSRRRAWQSSPGGHHHVGGQRREARRDLPDVQVVHLLDARVGRHRRADLARVHPLRRALQQHPARVAQQARTRPRASARTRSAPRSRPPRRSRWSRSQRPRRPPPARRRGPPGCAGTRPPRSGWRGWRAPAPSPRRRSPRRPARPTAITNAAVHVDGVPDPAHGLEADHAGQHQQRGAVDLRAQDLAALAGRR